MSADMQAIEGMLQDWASRISATIGGMVVQLQTKSMEVGEQEAILERIRGWHEYLEGVEEQLLELRRERLGDPVELFAGVWPPTAPLDLLAMWEALLEDIDGEGMVEYLGGDPYENSPLFPAWAEVDEVLHALDPTDEDSARAILCAAKRDQEMAGGSWAWGDSILELATAHAGPAWRP